MALPITEVRTVFVAGKYGSLYVNVLEYAKPFGDTLSADGAYTGVPDQ